MSLKNVGSVRSNHNSYSTGKLAVRKMALLREKSISVFLPENPPMISDDANRLH